MKPRRVFVTLELETDQPVSTLRRAKWWNDALYVLKTTTCEQAQANVVNKQKPKNRRKRK